MKAFNIVLSLLPFASAIKLLVPLYVYPLEGAWDSLFAAVEGHSTTTFQIVINPSSGPGSSKLPPQDYVKAISQLRAYPNVELIGYVRVSWAARDRSEVLNEIDTYAAWADYEDASLDMDGIFFDEAPSILDDDAVSYMDIVSTYAASAIGSRRTVARLQPLNMTTSSVSGVTSIFNMGTAPETTKYYDTGAKVVVMEWAYADYTANKLSESVPSTYASQSSVILHDFYGDIAALADFFDASLNLSLDSVSVTADCCYNTLGAVNGAAGIKVTAEVFSDVVA